MTVQQITLLRAETEGKRYVFIVWYCVFITKREVMQYLTKLFDFLENYDQLNVTTKLFNIIH